MSRTGASRVNPASYVPTTFFELAKIAASGRLGQKCIPDRRSFLKKALSYRTMPFHFEQIALHQAKQGGVNLGELADRFDFSNPTKLRDSMFIGMAETGLWNINGNGNNGWHIEMGPVSIYFHQLVFMPVKQHFQEKGGEK
jgi:hypothetical protein